MKRFVLLAGLVAAAATSPAFAGEGSGAFVRAEAGNSNISISGNDDNDTAYGVRGGYFFNANIGVEGFYTNYGKDSGGGVSAELDGYGIGIVGKKNMTSPHQGFFLSGRAGVAHTKLDVSVSGLGSASDTNNRVYLGVGAGYDFNEHVGLSLDVNHVRPQFYGETIRLTTATLGFEYRF